MILKDIIRSARGEEPVDLLLTHARVINVFSGEIVSGDIAIAHGCIVGFGDYSPKKPVDGHAPGLSNFDIYAYVAAGISSDHECTTAREAREKLMAGMHIMVREGTGAKNLEELLPVINEQTARRMMWCTDDRHPHDLLEEGHIDSMVRRAIHKGLDPVIAIQKC